LSDVPAALRLGRGGGERGETTRLRMRTVCGGGAAHTSRSATALARVGWTRVCYGAQQSQDPPARLWRSALGRLRSALCEHTHRDQCHRDSRPLAPPLLRAPPPPLSSHGGHGTVPAGVIRAGAGRPAQPRPLLQGRAPQCTSTPSAHLRALRALRAPPPPMSRRLSTARRPHRLTPDA
jgi:hypothetical protein